MFTEDYILRMINQAMAVLAAVLGFKAARQYTEAQQAINQALEHITGLRVDLLKQLDDESLLKVLTPQNELDTDRLAVVADLFKEEGDVLVAQGCVPESRQAYQRALRFDLEVALAMGAQASQELRNQIDELFRTLEGHPLPAETLFSLFNYAEQSGDRARANWAMEQLQGK